MEMIEFIKQPWPWYVAGPMIALVLFLLLHAGKRFGISSSLETVCTLGGAGKLSDYFKVDWRNRSWLILFVVGSIIGGFLTSQFLQNPEPIDLSASTIADLQGLGLGYDGNYVPEQIFSWQNLFSLQGLIFMVIGGFLIGFGTRYAGGCTSGHAISGLSDLQLPSLVATIGFFIGGLITTHLLLPIIFS